MIKKLLTSVVAKGGTSIIGLLLTYTITQSYSDFTSGYFFYLIALLMILVPLSRLGMDSYILKTISNSEFNEDFISTLVSAGIVVVGFTVVLSLCCYVLVRTNSFLEFLLLPFSVLCWSVLCLIALYYQASRNIFAFNLLYSGLYPALLIIGILFLSEGDDFNAVLLFSNICSLLVVVTYIIKFVLNKKSKIRIDTIIFLKNGIEFFPIVIITMLSAWFMPILIKYFSNIIEVSTYSVSHRLTMIIGLLVIATSGYVTPIFANFKTNKCEAIKAFHVSQKLVLVLSVSSCIILFLFAKEFLAIFGSSYVTREAILALRILALSQVINSISGNASQLMQMNGYQNKVTKMLIVNLIIMIGFGIPLIISFGAIGAAICVLLMALIKTCFFVYKLNKDFGINCLSFRVSST